MNRVLSVSKVAVVGGAFSLLAACHSEKITGFWFGDISSRPAEVAAGSRFDINVREGAFGSYGTPPGVSSAAVAFLGDEYPNQEPVPAGPMRTFHFRAQKAGMAAITLTPDHGPAIVDSIVVK